ncbi:HesB/YadR/YfhF family protein [Bacillus cereus]
MELKISKQAVNWFKNDIGVMEGDEIRFYAQFYGSSPVQDGYSLAFSKDTPIDKVVSTKLDGIEFFVDESDLWFFDGHDLHVGYDEQEDFLDYKYIKSDSGAKNTR